MIVIDFQYQNFSEVNYLNKNFIPGVKKLKLTIDAISSSKIYQKAYPIIAKQFNMLFPNLKRHVCCYQKLAPGVKAITKKSNSDEYIMNIIHLVEHIIIDIQCSVSKMKICSGITCNYYEPRNRYDIFVECVDKQVGHSAAQFATEIVQRIINNDRFILNYTSPQQSQLPLQNIIDSVLVEYDVPTYIENLTLLKN